MLTDTIYPPALVINEHFHECPFFCLVLKGTYTEVYGRRSRLCRPLSLVFHPSNEVHANNIDSGGNREFQIEFGSQWSDRVREHSNLLNDPVEFHGGRSALLALKIYHEFQNMDELSALAIEALMLEIIVLASRRPTAATERRKPGWLKQAEETIHAGFSGSLRVVELAASVGVHPVYFASEFRKYYRCTVGDFVRQLRITSACRKISDSNTPLADIALAVGFYDQSHFARTFKQLTGLTPAQYRRHTSPRL